jgi:hypothetical protein
MRGEGTWSAVSRVMAEVRACFSRTGLGLALRSNSIITGEHTTDLMKFIFPTLLVILLVCEYAFGQAGTQPQTFHIRGTITDPLEAVIRGVKVTFQNEQSSKIVTTNYEADLPLASYTMTAQSPGFRLYQRPLFRVTSPNAAILNATLLVGKPCGDMIIVDGSGERVRDDQWKVAPEHCRREEDNPDSVWRRGAVRTSELPTRSGVLNFPFATEIVRHLTAPTSTPTRRLLSTRVPSSWRITSFRCRPIGSLTM